MGSALDLEEVITACWCGSEQLAEFAPNYYRCRQCNTLISSPRPKAQNLLVQDDEKDFYGREYWLTHYQKDYGLPGIRERTRLDLPERCLYWLEHVLQYRLPPAKTLEVGCSHGGLVYLMKLAGFDAYGLELSKWTCSYAQEQFQIPMFCGQLAEVDIADNSVDMILMMDVLEHLPDPVATLQSISSKLTDDGIIVIQTPDYENMSYQQMLDTNAEFLNVLVPQEHLYLFNRTCIQHMLQQAGFAHIYFEPKLFAYDMFIFAAKKAITKQSSVPIHDNLAQRPESKIIQALLDLNDEKRKIISYWDESEADRAARLEVMHQLGKQLEQLGKQLAVSEADRAARLEVIHQLQRELAARDKKR